MLFLALLIDFVLLAEIKISSIVGMVHSIILARRNGFSQIRTGDEREIHVKQKKRCCWVENDSRFVKADLFTLVVPVRHYIWDLSGVFFVCYLGGVRGSARAFVAPQHLCKYSTREICFQQLHVIRGEGEFL